ncbi:MAG: hypothetical protein AB1546_08515 [bacterium]
MIPTKYGNKIGIFFFLLLLPSICSSTELNEVQFFKTNPDLLNVSSLSIEVDKTVKKPKRQRLGAFGIGGINAFTLMGLSYPFNTFHNMTTYHHPFFGDSGIRLAIAGNEIDFPRDAVWYVRDASIAVTREEDDRLAMFTVNFSPPQSGAFVRIVIVRAQQDLEGLRLIADVFGDKGTTDAEIIQTRDTGRRKRTLRIGSLDGAGRIAEGRLVVDIPQLKKGDEKVFYFYYIIQTGEKPEKPVIAELQAKKSGLLNDTVAYWKNYLKDSTRLITPDERLNDMIENMKIAHKIQRNESGAQVPVVKYADRSHDRENIHIARFYLLTGMPSDAREMMMYGYYAAQVEGAILNSQAADLDISALPETVDWENIPLDDADPIRRVAERPSWTILQFYRYYKHTGDLETIRKVYPYLKRNLLGQEKEVTPEGLLPFHGDDMCQITYPTYVSGVPLQELYSFDSSIAFVTASRGMEEISEKLGMEADRARFAELRARVEPAIDRYYWMDDGFYAAALRKKNLEPVVEIFSLTNLNPIVIGYEGDEKKLKLNLIKTIGQLGQKDGSIKMARRASLYHAQLQGMYLLNLKHFHHTLADKVFDLLIHKVSDPAGMFSEAQANDHTHISMSTDQTGKGKEDARRFGPWEGTVNAASLIYYLTGMSVDADSMTVRLVPEIPAGWDRWEMKDGRVKNNRFDFFVVDNGREINYHFVNNGAEPLNVSLFLPMGKRKLERVLINGAKKILRDITVTESGAGIDIINRKVDKELIVQIFYKY